MNAPLRKHLLGALRRAGQYAMPLRLIVEDTSETWTRSEVEEELNWLEADKLVVAGLSPLREKNYRLTANGQATAAELRV